MTAALDLEGWLHEHGLQLVWRQLEVVEELVCPPLILLPVGLSGAEQRWRTAHAVGHVELHCGNQLWMLRAGFGHMVRRQERQADEFAAGVLLPDQHLVIALNEGASVLDIADQFGVTISRAEFAIRLLTRRTAGASG